MLNILGCLDRPTTGTYHIDGIDTTTLIDQERTGVRSRRIGFVFQSFHLLSYRSVLENVMLAEVYRNQPQAGRPERDIAPLQRVGLGLPPGVYADETLRRRASAGGHRRLTEPAALRRAHGQSGLE